VCILCTACESYGDRVSSGHIEVFYREGISKETATRTARFLHDLEVQAQNDTTESKSMQLLKNKDTIIFRMVVNRERAAALNDDNYLALANYLSMNVFNNAPVNVDLTDNGFNTLRSLHFRKVNMED
ncbi:MAG: hypothetical protein ICV84_01680, partial [Flavisolibacter sp.]|nr:hypothetical protein [Flavisolibacter sp.]